MGEKYITEKILADYNDVFADIVNVLLFGGEQVVSPNDLVQTNTRSQYKADGKIHEQERDVAKLLKSENTTISLIGFENQTKPEKNMPARILSYDGQSYRTQMIGDGSKQLYPAITLVLYFGLEHWNYSKHLAQLLRIPEKFRTFVSDYEMKNLFEIAFLTPEKVKLFRSDFRYVADYFVQMRTTKSYVPSPEAILHKDATLKLFSVLTGDHRFEDAAKELPANGGVSMCEVLDKIEDRGIKKGFSQGEAVGEQKFGRLINAMISNKSSIEDISKASSDPEYRISLYIKYGID